MKAQTRINMGSRGYYSLAVLDKDGNTIKDKSSVIPTQNVITYAGAYYSLVDYHMFGNLYAEIGTGTVERTRASTALGAAVAGRSPGVSATREGNEVDNGDGTSTLTLSRTLAFRLGEHVGTFSEVGLYTGSTLVAGQLIKDEFGNPTTVTLLADEQLVVTYVLEWVVPNVSTLVGTIAITDSYGSNYACEIWCQPYFSNYAGIGSSDDLSGYATSPASENYALRKSDGISTTGPTGSSDPAIGNSNGHTNKGNGVIEYRFGFTASPTDFSVTDGAFIVFYDRYNKGPSSNDLDILDLNVPRVASTNLLLSAVILKIVPSISKSSSETLGISGTFEIQI